ncbi:hypothetical protein Ciccas_004186 [Cichlidogyrus casuarinus]|uniref:Uncharacterized protein n=1 Tax=Cichlidogyrus casuarinus TaxID=1844966 RepID=A0ABD2QC70_9PLAT
MWKNLTYKQSSIISLSESVYYPSLSVTSHVSLKQLFQAHQFSPQPPDPIEYHHWSGQVKPRRYWPNRANYYQPPPLSPPGLPCHYPPLHPHQGWNLHFRIRINQPEDRNVIQLMVPQLNLRGILTRVYRPPVDKIKFISKVCRLLRDVSSLTNGELVITGACNLPHIPWTRFSSSPRLGPILSASLELDFAPEALAYLIKLLSIHAIPYGLTSK